MPEEEQALIAICSIHQTGLVVWCNNGQVRSDVENLGSVDAALQLIDNDAPDHGLIIWEGHVNWIPSGNYFETETEPEYVIHRWRQPNSDEWQAIKEQRNPFEKHDLTL